MSSSWFFNKTLLFFIFLFFVVGCKNPEILSEKRIDALDINSGFLILCEGTFGFGNASVSFFDEARQEVLDDVFKQINQTHLGDQAQHLAFSKEYIFIAVQNSSKVEILTNPTFKRVGAVDAKVLPNTRAFSPRFVYASGQNKVYIADWYHDKIWVVDAKTLSLDTGIQVTEDPEYLLAVDKYLWVACAGYSKVKSANDQIAILDLKTHSVVRTIKTGKRPMQMVYDPNGFIWVFCKGFAVYNTEGTIDYLQSELPSLYKIGVYDFAVHKRYIFGKSFSDFKNLQAAHPQNDTEKMYFMHGENVYEMLFTDTLLPTKPIFTGNFYGISFNSLRKQIIACQPIDFTSKGYIIRYNYIQDIWKSIDKHQVGIIPNSAYFLK